MYLQARNWPNPVQPSEFWRMTLAEWLTEAKLYREVQEAASGKMSEDDRADLIEWVMNDASSN